MSHAATSKVVINASYGGFHLSNACIQRMTEIFNAERSEAPVTAEEVDYAFTRGYYSSGDADLYAVPIPDIEEYAEASTIVRIHPVLLQVIDELGDKACSGPCCHLRVLDVPTPLVKAVTITEYDGAESISYDLAPLLKKMIPNTPWDLKHTEATDLLARIRQLALQV